MKEFYAYQNDDGTYRLEIPIEAYDQNGTLLKGKSIVPRARLAIEALADISNGELHSIVIEEESNGQD